MNKQEKIKIVTKLVDQYKELDAQFTSLNKLIGVDGESKLWRAAWQIFDSYVDNTAKLLDYSIDSLSWFIWDNECGKKGLTCNNKKIKNVKDFVEFEEKELAWERARISAEMSKL